MSNRFTSGPSTDSDNVPKWDNVHWVEYHRTYLQPLEAVGGQPRVFDRMLEAGHHILNVAHPTRGVAVDVLVDAAKGEGELGSIKKFSDLHGSPKRSVPGLRESEFLRSLH